MPTPKKGPRLGSGPDHQRLLLSNLASQLFIHEGINTTEAKAKLLRPYAEKLITKAKKGDLAARREVLKDIPDRDVVALAQSLPARYQLRALDEGIKGPYQLDIEFKPYSCARPIHCGTARSETSRPVALSPASWLASMPIAPSGKRQPETKQRSRTLPGFRSP